MPIETLSHFVLLPELELLRISVPNRYFAIYHAQKRPEPEYCPKCASPSRSTYDHRVVRLKDEPLRQSRVRLEVRKRRLWCKPCGKPFTESLPGVKKGRRTTERYRSALMLACERFSDLKQVRKVFSCSNAFLYGAYYEQLELKRRTRLHPWPKVIGVDEHAFKRNKQFGQTDFVSMIVDYDHKKVMELVEGKTTAALSASLASIPGRERVESVCLDLCDPFKNFAREFFPQAKIVADKFHVLRLLSPSLLRRRKEITGDRASLRAKKLLLMSAHKLDYGANLAIYRFLEKYPELKELYGWKERLHGFYRTRGFDRASRALTAMTDAMALSLLPEIKTLRRTLLKWREEILNYFRTGLTNARVEGFNNKAKVVKRRAYGYKSFRNYRLRVLNACA
jgi:transposase